MNAEQIKQEQEQLTEYTPEPTGVVAAIAVKVLGLCDVRSLILVESEWREMVASPEARAYLTLLDAHLALHAQLAQADGQEVRGVVMVGRPVSRHQDDGLTLEVTRCCTDGAANACSMLYGAAWRATRAMGYQRLITYTLTSEGGGSLRAAGWRVIGQTEGGEWSRPSRPRPRVRQAGIKTLWEAHND